MAKFDFGRSQATALSLIDRFGVLVEVAFVRASQGEYDPVTGKTTGVSLSYTPATLVSLPATSGTIQGFDNRFIEMRREGKVRFFIVAHLGLLFTPSTGDYLIFEGAVWHVSGSTPLSPSGIEVIHNVGVQEGTVSELANLALPSAGGQALAGGISLEGLIQLIQENSQFANRIVELEDETDSLQNEANNDVETGELDW